LCLVAKETEGKLFFFFNQVNYQSIYRLSLVVGFIFVESQMTKVSILNRCHFFLVFIQFEGKIMTFFNFLLFF
jgi:hypothetical protein